MNEQSPPKRRTGRKPLNRVTVAKKLLSYIESGLNIKQSCAAAGIGVTTLREWRSADPTLEERLEGAREVMRAKVLAQIKAAGKSDYRALETFLRLAFAEYRFNSPQVNVALQNNISMSDSDPERASLIAKLEEARARALADKSGASEPPLQLTDASDGRAEALEAERRVKEGVIIEVHDAEPARLHEKPPTTVVERADLLGERKREWRWASSDEVEDVLGS